MTEKTTTEERSTSLRLLDASEEIEAVTGLENKWFGGDNSKRGTINVDVPSDQEFETISRILGDHGFEIGTKKRIEPRTEPEFLRIRVNDVRSDQ